MSKPISFFSEIWPNRYDEEGNPICRVCNRPVRKPKKFYCSDECSNLATEALSWDYARYLVWKRAGGKCEFPGCGRELPLYGGEGQVHHKIPVRKLGEFVWRELNRDPDFKKLSEEEQNRASCRAYAFMYNHPSNLILLCREHHNLVHSAERRRAYGFKPRWDKYEVSEAWRAFWRLNSQRTLVDFF